MSSTKMSRSKTADYALATMAGILAIVGAPTAPCGAAGEDQASSFRVAGAYRLAVTYYAGRIVASHRIRR